MLALALGLAALLAIVAVGQRLSGDLRDSVARMDSSLTSAQDRQREMVQRLTQTQAQLLAEQERLRSLEERLKAGETALSQARDALADLRSRDPQRLALRLESLVAQAARLPPGKPGVPAPFWPPGPPGLGASGQLVSLLETARFALARGDRALLGRSLDTAAAWLDAFFDRSDPNVAAVADEIAALRGLSLQPDLSSLREALSRARDSLAGSAPAGPLGVSTSSE